MAFPEAAAWSHNVAKTANYPSGLAVSFSADDKTISINRRTSLEIDGHRVSTAGDSKAGVMAALGPPTFEIPPLLQHSAVPVEHHCYSSGDYLLHVGYADGSVTDFSLRPAV